MALIGNRQQKTLWKLGSIRVLLATLGVAWEVKAFTK
jgi:hypothetical protein